MKDFRCLEKNNKYHDLLWKRGYFASLSGNLPLIHGAWKKWSFGNFSLLYDPVQPFSAQSSSNIFLLVLGNVVSLNIDSIVHQEIINGLFNKLIHSAEDFLCGLDDCCGRFVCFYSIGGKIFVLNDATGMRSVYYCNEPYTAVASHSFILKQYFNKKKSKDCQDFIKRSNLNKKNMSFLPGHCSVYDDIKILVPNNQLEMSRGELNRYFPRTELVTLSTKEVIANASQYLSDLTDKFSKISKLSVSLTAGLDSRLTTAATRKIRKKICYFTYVREKSEVNCVDSLVAQKLTTKHDLSFKQIFFNSEIDSLDSSYKNYKQFREVALKSVEMEHFIPLSYAYIKNYPSERLHLRSNIGEICRARYHKPVFDKIVNSKVSFLVKLVKIYNQWTRAKEDEFSYNQFEKYITETNLSKEAYSFDLFALYYWEHLMPVWQGSLLLESDLSHDTVSLFNCRSLLCTFLSAPFEEQISSANMLNVIENLWPDLLAEPINQKINTFHLKDINDYLAGYRLTPIPLIVHAQWSGNFVEVECEISEKFFTGDVEFAFYLIADGNRIKTIWYSCEKNATFFIDEEIKNMDLKVTGFVRELDNQKTKISKTVDVLTQPFS